MKVVFHGERNAAGNGSGLMGAFSTATTTTTTYAQMQTPPPEAGDLMASHFDVVQGRDADNKHGRRSAQEVTAWLEIYHWASGVSFRAFLTENGDEKSLFAFFDPNAVMGRELKPTVMALLELADYFGCASAVTCIDRRIPADDAKALIKGLQWANFDLITLDHWAGDVDVISKRWVFMGCDI